MALECDGEGKILLSDIVDEVNLKAYTVDSVVKTGDTMTGNLEAPSFTVGGDYLSPYSFKNKLMNGNKRVNQRGYADAVLGNGLYGYDRWQGSDSDVNIKQIIEQENITSGVYTISWVGGGTATVGGIANLVSGDSVTVTVSGNVSVIVPKASTNIQLEEGSINTAYEFRPIGLELLLCKRYYEKNIFDRLSTIYSASESGETIMITEKRAIPTLTFTTSEEVKFTSVALTSPNASTIYFSWIGNVASGVGGAIVNWTADAEL